MTLKTLVLGGTAAFALVCGGLVSQGFAQTQSQTPAAQDQSTQPADQSAPADQSMTGKSSAATDTTSAPKHHARHHRRMRTARNYSSKSERAQTRQLNQDQLAKAQAARQGQYGTSEPQPQAQPGSEPSNMNSPSSPSNSSSPAATPPSDQGPVQNQNMQNNAPPPTQNNAPPAANPQPNPQSPPQN
jgi:hypothetical protein